MMKFLPSEVEETLKQGRKEVGQGKNGSNVSSSDGNDLTTHKQEDHLKSAQAKMDEVREENERLKFTISQMMKDYNSLKTHFHGIVQQDQPQKSTDSASITAIDDESELVSLRLGRFSDDSKREQKKSSYESKHQKDTNQLGALELGLDYKFPSGRSAKLSKNPSPENSLDGSKEEENNTCHKSPKTARSGDDEVLEQNPLKKPRVSVRAVCDTQTMNDGCQWRKYGQKIAKGNPCPRAYYRCTFSSSCPVRKRVQRCAEDMSILTTTYEGTHNHPLPISATSMASATSAAAAMLKCGSSASPPPAHGVSAAASSSPNLLGFNFPSSNSLSTPCFPRACISTSQSHPTVILDLTVPNQTYSPYNRSSSSSFFPGLPSSSTACLNFSTSTSQIHNAYQQGIVGETNAAATKALITRNPTFQSALAAAITSIVGNGGIYDNLDQERKSGQNSKWGDQNINFSQPRSVPCGTIGCYWMNSQKKNLASFPPFSVSTSRASTLFLPDDGEQIKL